MLLCSNELFLAYIEARPGLIPILVTEDRQTARVIRQNENPARFPKAGSREPSWCGRYEGLCYGGSVSQTHGRGEGSSRNVRRGQPTGILSWKYRTTGCLSPGDRDRECLTRSRSELDNIGAVILWPVDHDTVLAAY